MDAIYMNLYSSHKDDALSAVKLLIKELQIDCINVRDQLKCIKLILMISVVLACSFAVIRFTRLGRENLTSKKKIQPGRRNTSGSKIQSKDKKCPLTKRYYMPY